jgi:hypothetical protein
MGVELGVAGVAVEVLVAVEVTVAVFTGFNVAEAVGVGVAEEAKSALGTASTGVALGRAAMVWAAMVEAITAAVA